MNSRRGSLVSSLLFIGIVTIAVIVRLAHIQDSLWLDELHTAWTVGAGLREIPHRAAIGNQSPLYFSGLWCYVQLLGCSELTLRLPSVIAGVGLVAGAGLVAYRWTARRTAACLAAWLLAVDPTCLFYSQEARPYAWVQLVGLLQAAVFFELLQGGGRRLRLAWITLSLLLFYLHYTAAILLAAEAVAYVLLLAWPYFSVRYRPRQWILDASVFLVGCVPAIPQLLAIADRKENWAAFVRERPFSELATAFFPLWLCITLPILCVVAACLFVWLGRRIASSQSRWSWNAWLSEGGGGEPSSAVGGMPPTSPANAAARWSAAVLLCCCWLFVPLILTWSTTHTGLARLFFLRYVLVATAAPVLLSGLVIRACPTAYWRLATCLIVGAVALSQSGILYGLAREGRVAPNRNQDWRGAIAWLNREAAVGPGPVLIRSGLIESDALREDAENADLRAYCLLPVTSLYPLGVDDSRQVALTMTRAGRLSAEDRERLRSAGQTWLLLAGGPRVAEAVIADLQAGWPDSQPPLRVAQIQTFGSVRGAHLVSP